MPEPHTSREFWEQFNQEYQDDPVGGPPAWGTAQLAGAVTITALTTEPNNELGIFPALAFRFVDHKGEFLDPVVLVLDDNVMRKLTKLVDSAAYAAIRKADLLRRERRRGDKSKGK